MKPSFLIYTCLVASVLAVYPPVPVDKELGDDLVTIQEDGSISDQAAAGDLGLATSDTKEEGPRLKDTAVATKATLRQANDMPQKKKRSPFESFLMSISMIVVSEIGDKTFLVAAIMAMRFPKKVVFSAAFGALALMTILSGVVGHVLPTLLSRRVTQYLASVLFLVFGTKLLKEGLETSKNEGVQGEMAEVEEEISAASINMRADEAEAAAIDLGRQEGDQSMEFMGSDNKLEKLRAVMLQTAEHIFSPAWIQTFVMTFLGEWGDRSQIATIALAAGSDYIQVILGGIIGHGLCTGMAVIGGQYLASKISVRTVLLGGSAAFYVFALTYLYSAYYDIE